MMDVRSPVVHSSPSRRLTGSLCLHWVGTGIYLVGFLLLARDGFSWFKEGASVDVAITTLSGILPSLRHISAPTAWHQLLQGSLEFYGAVPLSLILLALGWCIRTLTHVGQEGA